MKDEEIERPQAMKIRQGIQDAMTYSLPDKQFSEEKIDLVEVNIELADLGWNFNNYKILNLTDIHLGQWINPEYLEDLIDYVNTLNYDLVTLTGDYFSYVVDGYEEALADSFKKLKSRDGKFGVLGNHDHWMGSSIIRDIFKKSDIIDLSNDVHTLERDGEFLNICGVDSCTVCADNLDRVIAKMPKGIPKVETTPFRGPNSTKYPVGLYKVRDMIQYTSKGLGTNSFRIRINCKPEVTIITLKTSKKQKIEIE